MTGDRRNRLALRGATAGLLAALGTALLAAPAAAHVEVSADNAQALAEDVVVSFHGEAESDTAGVTGMQIVLPDGIAPADVALESAPQGWTFEPTDDGYLVSGPALPVGQAAEHAVRVRQLPDAERLAFRTLQNYSDGEVARWIQLPSADGTEPDNPAPVLNLAPAAPGATTAAPAQTPEAPAATPTPATPDTGAAAAASQDDDGVPVGVWAVVALVILAAVVVVVRLGVRRQAGKSA